MTAQSVSERSPVSQEKAGYSVITNSPHLSFLQQGFLAFREHAVDMVVFLGPLITMCWLLIPSGFGLLFPYGHMLP